MNQAIVVIAIVAILTVGIYIGVSNLTQQYAVVPGGSNADQYACAPERTAAKTGQQVKFIASVPEGTAYYWSAPDATSSFTISGPLTAQYGRAGTKNVYLFYVVNDRWYRTNCSVVIQ